jgi:deoxycytidine triphosphate deaminase
MATAAKVSAKEKETFTVFIPAQSRDDTERFVGTPKGSYLVKTNTAVEVPKDVKEVLELAEMQQNSIEETIEKYRLKDD